jgi:hypothetical protein
MYLIKRLISKIHEVLQLNNKNETTQFKMGTGLMEKRIILRSYKNAQYSYDRMLNTNSYKCQIKQ